MATISFGHHAARRASVDRDDTERTPGGSTSNDWTHGGSEKKVVLRKGDEEKVQEDVLPVRELVSYNGPAAGLWVRESKRVM